jgi:Flp pilus assembly protein TadG
MIGLATVSGKKRGGAAVEFALILPLFIMMLSAIMDYGYYFYVQNYMTNSVRNGVRMGVTKKGATLADQKAQIHDLACKHAKEALVEDFNLSCKSTGGMTDICTCTAKHKKHTYNSENWWTYQLTLTRPFTPAMGMIPAPKYNSAQYTMRYEY